MMTIRPFMDCLGRIGLADGEFANEGIDLRRLGRVAYLSLLKVCDGMWWGGYVGAFIGIELCLRCVRIFLHGLK